MKKIKYLPILFCFISISHSPAQTYINFWDNTYGGNSRDWNCQVNQNSSNQLFLIGDAQTDVDGNKSVQLCDTTIANADIWLIKIDSSGAILWQKNLGARSDERFPQLLHLNNSAKEMIFASFSTSDTACDKTTLNCDTTPLISPDYWLCLLDSNGSKIWDKSFGGDNFDDYPQIARLANGDIILSGESNSPDTCNKTVANYSISNDLWTVKINSSGAIIWDKVYGGTNAEYITSVISLAGGAFLLAGSTQSDISGDVSQASQGGLDYWMIKIDNAGNKIWDKRFGGSLGEKCAHTSQTPDGGFIMCGFTTSPQGGDVSEPPKGTQDYWVVKTDSNGIKLWDKRYGGNNGSFGTWVEPAANGYWILGYTNSDNVIDVTEPTYGGSDYWILRTDTSGNKQWDKRFGGDANDYSTSFTMLQDSSIILCGYSDFSGVTATKQDVSYGWYDYWLVKFRYSTPTGINEITNTQSLFSLYPNPGNGKYILNYLPGDKLVADLIVYDLVGKEVFSSDDITPNNYLVDISNFSRGVYFLKVNISGKTSFSEKLIKLF